MHFGPKITCVIGGQAGSEGKGMICGYLADECDVSVRVGGPNAGHTLKIGDNIWKMQQIPVAGLVNLDCVLMIGAGGLINLDILKREMSYIEDIEGRFFIDRNAGIIGSDIYKKQEEQEKMFDGIGSTCEGVGAALRHKVQRDGKFITAKDISELHRYIINVSNYINDLSTTHSVMIEGTQGYELSLNHGPYPYCTSRDVLASSLLSDIGLSPYLCSEIVMVIRTYPIRVAGNSGPMVDEINWPTVQSESGYPTELIEKTTVTKRTRRVSRFDINKVIEAVNVNRPDYLALTFVDYISYEDYGKTKLKDLTTKSRKFIEWIEEKTNTNVLLIKTGPEFTHIIDER